MLIVLMIAPEGFDYSQLDSLGAPSSGGLVSRLAWLGVLVVGLAVIVWRIRLSLVFVRWLNPFLLAFVALAIVSVMWSIDPQVTARRGLRVVAILSACSAFALIGWHSRRFQNLVRPVITAVLIGSLLFGVFWPELAIHQEATGVLARAWHGLSSHKNGLGDIACVGLIFWFHAWRCRDVRGLHAALGIGVSLACLLLSRSSTSLIAAAFTLCFLALFLHFPRDLRRFMPYFATIFVLTLLAFSIAMIDIVPGSQLLLKPVAMLTGKDLSFTGRTVIWFITSEHIQLQPLMGSGYGAYWTGPIAGTASYEFVRLMNFYPGSAHNGYLDVLNDLGVVGLLVLLGYLLVFLVQSLRLLRVDRDQASLYLALFLHQSIANLAESRWLSVFSVDFVIMTLATTALARALLQHHWRGQQMRAAAWAQALDEHRRVYGLSAGEGRA
ncbi:MAG TPA: O-antigen ligase family protein [Arenimonas sp.]|nr:O-antigen ligase family protein [Arenimonas sp.]